MQLCINALYDLAVVRKIFFMKASTNYLSVVHKNAFYPDGI